MTPDCSPPMDVVSTNEIVHEEDDDDDDDEGIFNILNKISFITYSFIQVMMMMMTILE